MYIYIYIYIYIYTYIYIYISSLQHEKAVPCFNHTEKLFFSSDTRQSMKRRIATER